MGTTDDVRVPAELVYRTSRAAALSRVLNALDALEDLRARRLAFAREHGARDYIESRFPPIITGLVFDGKPPRGWIDRGTHAVTDGRRRIGIEANERMGELQAGLLETPLAAAGMPQTQYANRSVWVAGFDTGDLRAAKPVIYAFWGSAAIADLIEARLDPADG